MLHVEFKELPMSCFFPMSKGFMSHVDFKKWPCHPVEFKGQGPCYCVDTFLDLSLNLNWSLPVYKLVTNYGEGGGATC